MTRTPRTAARRTVRFCARVLVVLGGAIVTTVIAWLLAGNASADTENTPDRPAVDLPGGEVVGQLDKAAKDAAGKFGHPLAGDVGRPLAGELEHTAKQLTDESEPGAQHVPNLSKPVAESVGKGGKDVMPSAEEHVDAGSLRDRLREGAGVVRDLLGAPLQGVHQLGGGMPTPFDFVDGTVGDGFTALAPPPRPADPGPPARSPGPPEPHVGDQAVHAPATTRLASGEAPDAAAPDATDVPSDTSDTPDSRPHWKPTGLPLQHGNTGTTLHQLDMQFGCLPFGAACPRNAGTAKLPNHARQYPDTAASRPGDSPD
ncbi:MAG: hypothetical protein GEU98_08135 [Pseudonocardiaceae bacterium]|nr:hypothetical protein [Pseudonocardiaceae bacterium]